MSEDCDDVTHAEVLHREIARESAKLVAAEAKVKKVKDRIRTLEEELKKEGRRLVKTH